MTDEQWFRRTTWTSQDREAFFLRLRRSRSAFHKAQYALIQAASLISTKTAEGYRAALELLDMILAEWRDSARLADVFDCRARCCVGLGDMEGAVIAYRQVFETQRLRPSVLTNAHLDFGWLVATAPLPEHHDEALAVLDEFDIGPFPLAQYQASVARALIYDALGDTKSARECAQHAMDAAAAQHSGFRYHPGLGLVDSPDETIHGRVRHLAKSLKA
jgi:hypothetical protein